MAWLRRCWFCPDDRAGWIGPASRLAVRLMKASSPDAIWTTSYPHSAHLVGLRLKRRFPAIPWIADFRDGWTQNDDFFLPLSARLRRRGACLERLVAREADAIAAASEPIAAHFRDLLSAELGEAEARRRVRAIPNGFDAEDLAAAEPRPWPGFCLVYAGTLFGDRTAEPLLAAAAAIRQSGEMARDLHLGFVGAFDESLFAAARRHGVAERLIAPGPMSHRQALGAQQSAGALAAIVPRTPNAAIMATQKIYEYLAAGPPVLLLAPDCPAKKLVESAGGGMVFDPAEPERAAAGLIAMRKQSEAGQWRRADPAVLAPFERTALTRRLADLLDSLTGD